MYDFIKKTSQDLAFSNFKVVKGDVFKFIRINYGKYDFIFAGPPYALAYYR
jgi:methylase of polypeptide subunit release factors